MKNIKNKKPLLRIYKLNKWYNEVHALNDFSCKIYPGEAIALIGDNGAGKSTFAKILAGVIRKNSGQIFWKGKEVRINSIKDARNLGIETVYQEQALTEQLTITRNIFLGREITKHGFLNVLNINLMQKKAKGVINELGLKVPVNQQVRFCSGGERQGVAVARSFLFKAKLAILDEPTRGISVEGVKRIINFIKELKKEKIAVILISHIFPHIFPVTDRFIVLSRGKIISEKFQVETSPKELSKILTAKEH
jgi:simple sugar transport system ATP-binding protein